MTEAQTSIEARPVGELDAEDDEQPISDRITTIRPISSAPFIDFRELWQFRELAGVLAWRDFSVRYKQTAIGIAWVVLQPVVSTIVFTVIFGNFADFPSDDLPYPVFTYAGLLLWTYFASSLQRAGTSLVTNKALVTKVYFPRVLLPAASVVSPVIDLVFASSVLWMLMVYFDVAPHWTIVLTPLFIALTAMVALGVGLWLAAVNVRYRDVPYVIPFLLQTWMFLSPVLYQPTNLPERLQWVYSLNPMNGAILGFRWALIGSTPPTWTQIAISVGASALLLAVGLMFFKRSEPRFADTM
jgi:homopolymeric O-antigen transport system permease protein